MSPDPTGRWLVRADPLGTRTDACRHGVHDVELHVEGSVVVEDGHGGREASGSWRPVGEGRLLVSVRGEWGEVEAAVELSSDGWALAGRALVRRAVSPPDGRPDVTVIEVEAYRSDASAPTDRPS